MEIFFNTDEKKLITDLLITEPVKYIRIRSDLIFFLI